MSLRKCRAFVANLRAIQQNANHHFIHRNTSHHHTKNCPCKNCQWDMSVQNPELLNLSLIFGFQDRTNQLSRFYPCTNLCFSVFGDEGVVSARSSSNYTQKRTTSARTSVLWAQTSGEKVFPSREKLTQLTIHQRIENFSACCIVTIPALVVSHHNPLHTDAALPRWEKCPTNAATMDKTDHKPGQKTHTQNSAQS